MPTSLSQRIRQKRLIVAPGVYDLISMKVADAFGFEALYMTGYGTVGAAYGLPDAGLATYTEMLDRVRAMAQSTPTPLVADADTGYGGLLNVQRTVRGYEAAGAAAIQLEDQEFPKKCGHTSGRRVVTAAEMVRKIRVAVESRSSKDLLVIARTDARTQLGLDEALRRAEAYARAGADVLFVESPETEEELRRIGQAFDLPLLVNVVHGGRTPVLAPADYEAMGFRIAIYPAAGFLAAAHALRGAYGRLRDGEPLPDATLYPFTDFHRLMGFERIWEFERTHGETD